MRLTDEELCHLNDLAAAMCAGSGDWGRVLTALKELRELRALLATPFPTWLSEHHRPKSSAPDDSGECSIGCAGPRDDLTPDEAIGYGAEFIRAALAAREGKP